MNISRPSSVSRSPYIARTTLEIDQDINPLLKKIRSEVMQRLSYRHTLVPYSKKFLYTLLTNPVNSVYKIFFFGGSAYILYLLTRGTFAGIEVDNDTNFSDVFSSNKDVRLNAGLNLTNGDQAGQFIGDAAVVSYLAFNVIFRDSYYKFAGTVINDCYKKYLIELLDLIENKKPDEGDIEEGALSSEDLIRYKENINRLYEHLEKDLIPYGQEPIFYKKVLLVPHHQIEEESH